MKKIFLFVIYFLFCAVAISQTSPIEEPVKQAEDSKQEVPKNPPLKFKAKKHYQDLEKNITILEGNAWLQYGDTILEAGRVVLEKEKNEIRAFDNVRLNIPSEQTHIKAYTLFYNYKTRLGEMINAEVKSGYTVLRAEKIQKVGDQKYHTYKGTFSTCDVKEGESCPWKIWSYQSDATIGGYATAEHPIFLVGGIPLLYSPFFFFPIKSERQSGFLIPAFESTQKGGFGIKNALFLTLGRSHDITPSFEYLANRGFKEGLEYRYKLSPLSEGLFNGYYIQDRLFYKDFNYRRRFGATYDHSIYFTPQFFNKASIHLVSDDDYVKDFQKDIVGRYDAGLETKLLQGLITENASFNLETIYFQNLLSDHPTEGNHDVIHKLPEFSMNVPQSYFWDLPFTLGGNFMYTHFYNEKGKFKDTNGNGQFEEGIDKLLNAHRTDIFPAVGLPLQFERYFELVPQVGVRQTQWWLPAGDKSKNRFMLDAATNLTTNVSRVYAYNGKSVDKIKHVIEPRFSHHYSPFILVDHTIPVFDGLDQLANVHQLTWGLQHRLIFKTLDKAHNANYADGLRFDMSQNYNILEARKKADFPRPWSDIAGILSAGIASFGVSTEADLSVYGDQFTRVSHGMQYTDPWTDVYRLNYTYKKDTPSSSINGGAGFNFIELLKFNFSLNYSLDKKRFLEKIYQATYFPKTKCWALNLNFEDKVDSGFAFSANVNLMFGDNFLSLANLYQAGESQNLRFLSGQGSASDDLNGLPK